jgi:hypothetical protein
MKDITFIMLTKIVKALNRIRHSEYFNKQYYKYINDYFD